MRPDPNDQIDYNSRSKKARFLQGPLRSGLRLASDLLVSKGKA
ncbi:hypothetical protein [Roseateles oligotrophus]|nr:hypothetical protein [Roseateles oligotrophus]